MTPAVRALEAAGIPFELHEYARTPDNRRSARTGQRTTGGNYGLEAAAALGLSGDVVFKTLLVTTDTGELVVAVVPVSGQLSMKAAAAAAGAKRATMCDPAEAERSSGYVVGGISPIGQRKQLRTVVDESATTLEMVYVSGGRRGLDIGLAPGDLVTLLGATVAPLVG